MEQATYNSFLIVCKKHGCCSDEHKYGIKPDGKRYKAVVEPARFKDKDAILFKYTGGLKMNHVARHYPEEDFDLYPLPKKIRKMQKNGYHIVGNDEEVEKYRKELYSKLEGTDTEEREDNNEDEEDDADPPVKKIKNEISEAIKVRRPRKKPSLTYALIFDNKNKPRKCKKLPKKPNEEEKIHTAIKDLYKRVAKVEDESFDIRNDIGRLITSTSLLADRLENLKIKQKKEMEALEKKLEISNVPDLGFGVGDYISKI